MSPRKIDTALTDLPDSMSEPEIIHIGDGTAVFYSSRAPDKLTANEDSLALIPVNDMATVLVVADGLGGLPAGEEASKHVIDTLVLTMDRVKNEEISIREAILDGIEQANTQLLESGNGSATTVVVAEIQGNILRTYHAGDSMIMLVGNKGKIKYSIIPHSPTGYALEAGIINESEAMLHDERHIISNFIGSPEMRLEIGPPVKMSPRDTLVLASDGLSDNLYEDEIAEMSRKGPLIKRAQQLIQSGQRFMRNVVSDRQPHPDDMTFILYRPNTRAKPLA